MDWRTPPLAGLAALLLADPAPAAVFAAEVIDYSPGAGAFLTDPAAALGRPHPIVGEGTGFDAPLGPFSPHYEGDQIVQIGEGGHLVLRLSHRVDIAAPVVTPVGIFGNAGLVDVDFPNGIAGDPVGTFGADPVTVRFSDDGETWYGQTDLTLDQPTAYFTDTAATAPADFGQSHTLALPDYAGQDLAGILASLGGSAGGNWVSIPTTVPVAPAFVRLEVPDDGDPDTTITAEIDAIAIENRAVGAPVPEPAAAALVALGLLLHLARRRP